jgi:transposase-like protein
MVQEGGKVIMKKVEDRKRKTLLPIIEKYVEKGTHINADELPSYKKLGKKGYIHSTVNHNQEEYVNVEGKHTKTIEGVWSILKRSISSTHVWVSDSTFPNTLMNLSSGIITDIPARRCLKQSQVICHYHLPHYILDFDAKMSFCMFNKPFTEL